MIKATTKVIWEQDKLIKSVDKKVDGAYRYIGGAIRRAAKGSIRKGSANRPSEPGGPATSPTGNLKRSIVYDYNSRKKTLVVGPKLQGAKPSQSKPGGGKTIPQTLEEGGEVIVGSKKFLPAKKVPMKYRKAELQKLRRRRKGQRLTLKDVKYVQIPKGRHKIKARPTMQLAYAKILTVPNLQRAFDRIRA